MNIEADYIGSSFELSKPIGKMAWTKAMSASWPDSWRMPTRGELVTLFDESVEAGHKFADKSLVWSASSYSPPVPPNAWIVKFSNGSSVTYSKSNWGAVRLVREVKKPQKSEEQ